MLCFLDTLKSQEYEDENAGKNRLRDCLISKLQDKQQQQHVTLWVEVSNLGLVYHTTKRARNGAGKLITTPAKERT